MRNGAPAAAVAMTLALVLTAAGLVLSGCVAAPQWGLLPGQHAERVQGRVAKQVECQFLLYLPHDFQPRATRRYPLLIFLHGSGESG